MSKYTFLLLCAVSFVQCHGARGDERTPLLGDDSCRVHVVIDGQPVRSFMLTSEGANSLSRSLASLLRQRLVERRQQALHQEELRRQAELRQRQLKAQFKFGLKEVDAHVVRASILGGFQPRLCDLDRHNARMVRKNVAFGMVHAVLAVRERHDDADRTMSVWRDCKRRGREIKKMLRNSLQRRR